MIQHPHHIRCRCIADDKEGQKPAGFSLPPQQTTTAPGRFKQSLARYLAIVGVYLLGLTVLKVVELLVLGEGSLQARIWVHALVYNLIVASWEALAIGILYFLIRLLSERAAVITAAILYALLLLSETGLTLYVAHNGFLLGCELAVRPFNETLMAIKGAMGVVVPLVLVAVLTGGIALIALWCAKRPTPAVWATAVVVGLLIVLSLIFKMSHLVVNNYRQYILNKTLYLVNDCRVYFRQTRHNPANGQQTEYNQQYIAELLATHPEWGTPLDPHYPLERSTPADTFLSPYFQSGKATPNIVIIIVESLGAEMMGTGAMPFVDSLAATGLYWPNCLSTTMRSYGAIPAVTGSVGGPRSFQFGTMPDHNSLFSLLKSSGYNTRAYYAGDFHFDCIYDYLTAQRLDYLSPLYDEFVSSPPQGAYWWGYNDDILFAHTLNDLEGYSRHPHHAPHLSLVTTLSMHEELRLPDKALQQDYQRRASLLKPAGAGLASLFTACLFTDDCLRRFINGYRKLPAYANTLFVITGDHASGRQHGDYLASHHVPLILWSPLVKRPAAFTHLVTHNDIAPALYSLLTSRFGLKPHPTVHWLGDGLGPSPKTLVVVNYIHTIQNIIYRNHYYQPANNYLSEEFYSFGPDLTLHPCSDTAALHTCRRQIELLRYLYAYTYNANRLTAHPVRANRYTTAAIFLPDTAVTSLTPASHSSYTEHPLLNTTPLHATQSYTTARVTLEADATIVGNPSMEQYHILTFHLTDGKGEQRYDEPLYRNYTNGKHLSVTKTFLLNGAEAPLLAITLHPPYSQADWLAGSSVTLSNIKITIEYGK